MSSDALKFGPRAPRQPGEYSATAPLAFLEIPQPDPSTALALTDTSADLSENEAPRGIDILFNGESGGVQVGRNMSSLAGDLSGAPALTFRTLGPVESTAATPLRILRAQTDPTGGWTPVISRGITYRVWQMTEAESEDSWLYSAGFRNGQYLVLGYTTEIDGLVTSNASSWNGLGLSGGCPTWTALQPIASSNLNTINILPGNTSTGVNQGTLLALGGLRTETGTELLAEPAQYSRSSVLLAPGDGNFPFHQFQVCAYDSAGNTPLTGSLIGPSPFGQTTLPASGTWTALTTMNATDAGASGHQTGSCILQFSGSLYASQDGFYTLDFTYTGNLRVYHWNLPVIDRWYGTQVSGSCKGNYLVYLHEGWHDLLFNWAPTQDSDTLTLTQGGPAPLLFAANTTTRSQVQGINTVLGQITLKQDYLGNQSPTAPQILVTYGFSSTPLPYRGYRNSAGGFVGLDLNPAIGRVYSVDNGTVLPDTAPTTNWALNNSCWIYAIPSMACALTLAPSGAISTGERNWETCTTYGIYSTIRWASLPGETALQSGIATIPLGSLSTFESALLGVTPYSVSRSVGGLGGQPDPRGGYDSAIILGHLDVVGGLVSPEDILVHDIRSRGGGLFQENLPSQLPTGGPRERTQTFWDESPWDGYEVPIDGTALVTVPNAVLTGSDGGPIFTRSEVEELVQKSVALGIKPVILYTD